MLTNVDNRVTTSLDGSWHIIIDPYETGYYDYRFLPSDDGYFRNAKPQSPGDLIEYDFDNSPVLQVPGDWNTQRPDLYYYEGTVWYQRSFAHSPKPGRRWFLYFGAVNYEAIVYVNGELVVEHTGGFTPFSIEVTDVLREGDNDVVLKVDNRRIPEGVPTVNTDWWNYGGITRRVLLVATPETYVEETFVRLDPKDASRIVAEVALSDEASGVLVEFSIPELDVTVSQETGPDGRVVFRVAASPERWSPENPRTYEVIVTTPTETLQDHIGFRTIETRGTEILLNGEPVFLRGISIHEEAPFGRGRMWNAADARSVLQWAKDLGCNYVRLAHYPHNEFMVRQAEEMGLLVWAEIPVYWTIHWDNPETLALATDQLDAMIRRDRNRACVILWSVANETPVSEARNSFLRSLVQHARSLDDSRLLTAAMERIYTDPETILIDDPLGASLDVLGCNEYLGWYDGPPDKCDDVTWESVYDKPVIMSELGGGARFGHHGPDDHRWTEEYQDSVYRHQTEMLDRIPFLAGMSPWILYDFRSPRRPLPGIQDGWNRKGLLSENGEPKAAFETLRTYYAGRTAASE